MQNGNSLKDRTKTALIQLKESKSVISAAIGKVGEDEGLVAMLEKVTLIESLLKDSYKTTIEGKNKSDEDAKNNFKILFDVSSKIGEATEELKENLRKIEAPAT